MPKREPTPPPGDDEPKFFVVSFPYPLHAKMGVAEEKIEFARWISCIIGTNDFIALYDKPSALNMVIIEVSKYCPNVNALLGAHKWDEILRQPEVNEKNIQSRIFYSKLNKGREVQKMGWKRRDVLDSWFKDFDPRNCQFTYPYPKSHYCDVPTEAGSDVKLCCPLPRAEFPVQTVVVRSVPGSKAWINSKSSGETPPALTKIITPAAVKPMGKQASLSSSLAASRVKVTPSVTSTVHPKTDRVTVPTTAWHVRKAHTPSASVLPSKPSQSAWSLGAPPGLLAPPGLPLLHVPNPATLHVCPSSSINGCTSDNQSNMFASPPGSDTWEGFEGSSEFSTISPTKSNTDFISKNSPSTPAPANDSGWGQAGGSKTIPSGWTDHGDDVPAAEVVIVQHEPEPSSDTVNYWDREYKDPDLDKDLCPVHKVDCKPGICQVRSQQKAKEKKEKDKAGKESDNGWVKTSGRGRGAQRGNREWRGGRGGNRGWGRGWANKA